MKIEPNTKEAKSQNVNARVRPSIRSGLEKMAEDLSYTKSELIDLIIEAAIADHKSANSRKRK